MAQDNPFLNLFESIGAGMEAGQRRRNLMERARQGEISPQEVPGLGMTALMGAVRAATPASTRLAQDQLKLQAVNYALQRKTAEDRQAAIDAQNYYKNTVEAKEAEDNLHDAVLLNEKFNLINTAAKLGSTPSIYSVTAEKGEFKSPDSYEAFNKYKNDVLNLQSTRKSGEVHGFRERLIDTGYVPEEVALMPRWKVEQSIKMEDDRFEDVEARAMLLPYEEGQALLSRIKTPGSMQDRSEALSEIYNATSSLALGSSPLAKIYQGRQAAQENNLDLKPWDNLIAKITSGDASPGMSIQLPDGTKVVVPASSSAIEDKETLTNLTVKIPQQLALMNTVDRMLSNMEESELGLIGAGRRTLGPIALQAEGLANFFGVELPDVLTDIYSPNIEALVQNRVGLAQAIKNSVRTDVGPISNYEDARLAPIIQTLESPASTKEQLVDSVSSLRGILNTMQFLNAYSLGRVPVVLQSFPDLASSMRYLRGMRQELAQPLPDGSRLSVPLVSDRDFASYEKILQMRFPEQYDALRK